MNSHVTKELNNSAYNKKQLQKAIFISYSVFLYLVGAKSKLDEQPCNGYKWSSPLMHCT